MADGTLAIDVPETVVVERPRNREHGDYATNLAMTLAKKAGMRPRELAELLKSRLDGSARGGGGGDRRTRLPQHHGGPGDAGRTRGPHRAGGRVLRAGAGSGRDLDQRRVHLGQPDRPAAPGPHPLGRAGGCAGPGAAGRGRRGRPGVLHQRPRRPDGPVRDVDRSRGEGPADPRGRLPRRLHQRPGRRGAGRAPALRRTAGRGAAGGVPRGWLQAPAEAAAGRAAPVPHRLRRLVLRALPARLRRGGPGPGQAARAGPRLRAGRRGLAAHHRLRRRQGPGADQGRRRDDLLRLRHRVLRGQARPRLRRQHLPAGRRPPRLRQPAARRGRLRRATTWTTTSRS